MNIAEQKIAFIGGGNMAHALVAGLLAKGVDAKNIWVTGRDQDKLAAYATLGATTAINNSVAVAACDLVVLCVKPLQLKAVCLELRDVIAARKPLVISVVTGVTLSLFERWLGPAIAVVRAMPNTPSRLSLGVTGFTANIHAQKQLALAEGLLKSVGSTFYFEDERHLDIVTALSGSGPAYVFLFMEALQAAAVAAGLTPEDAAVMTQQTVLGAAQMALCSKSEVVELRQAVTSKGGTTEQALLAFAQGGFSELIAEAFNQALQRAREITVALEAAD